jgi:hypothetical protein
MVQVSNDFLAALQAGAPQRWAFIWANGTILTNEDISVEDGVRYDETFCSETDLTVGLTPSCTMSFTLLNDQLQLLNFPFGRFTAKLGVRLSVTANNSAATDHPTVVVDGNSMTVSGNGKLETYELCPFGVFYAERPDILRKVLIDIEAFDQMVLFDRDMPSATALNITYPITAGALLQAMCTYLSTATGTTIAADSYTFTNYSVQLAKEPESFKTASMRDVLGWIAELACAVARFNRSGTLTFVWLNRINKSYDEHNYTEFERTEFSTTSVSKLSVRNADQTQETVVGTGDSPYMIQDNPFLNQA